MGKDSVVEFLKQMQADESLQQKIDAEGKSTDEIAAALVALGSEHGHDFTVEECCSVVDAVHAYHAKESAELGEAELEKAAGGLGTTGKAQPASSYRTLGSLVGSTFLSPFKRK